MVVVHVEWLGEQTVRVQSQGTSIQVTFDAGLSIHQVAGACRELGDIGWEALGQWCTLMKGHTARLAEYDANVSMLSLVTPDHILRWVSPQIQDIFGWSEREVLNHDVRELGCPDQLSSGDGIALHRDYEGHNSSPFMGKTRFGNVLPVVATSWPIYDASHALVASLKECRPIPA